MLGLGHGMKCKREESIIQGTEDWLCVKTSLSARDNVGVKQVKSLLSRSYVFVKGDRKAQK